MSCTVLVVDDMKSNLLYVKAKLERNYYNVLLAQNGKIALEMVKKHDPDIILLDIVMPELDGFEVCRIIKSDVNTRHIPIIMITALDAEEDMIKGLSVKADEFLTKPINETILMARINNLKNWKMKADELRLRYLTGKEVGAIPNTIDFKSDKTSNVALLNLDNDQIEIFNSKIGNNISTTKFNCDDLDINELVKYDLIVMNLLKGNKNLRLAAKLRSNITLRSIAILGIIDNKTSNIKQAMEIGVNDVITTPINVHELNARINTLLHYKHYFDHLRNSFQKGLELAVKDSLTNINNRTFFETQLAAVHESSKQLQQSFCLMISDIDFFKSVNDTFGHLVGDDILVEVAKRICNNVRQFDHVCRYGGEEFVVIMPRTSMEEAKTIAERLRKVIQDNPFSDRNSGKKIDITISIGLACFDPLKDQPIKAVELMDKADKALYKAKNTGRNKLVVNN